MGFECHTFLSIEKLTSTFEAQDLQLRTILHDCNALRGVKGCNIRPDLCNHCDLQFVLHFSPLQITPPPPSIARVIIPYLLFTLNALLYFIITKWTFLCGFFLVFTMVSRRRFEQIDVLEGINVLTTISGKRFLLFFTIVHWSAWYIKIFKLNRNILIKKYMGHKLLWPRDFPIVAFLRNNFITFFALSKRHTMLSIKNFVLYFVLQVKQINYACIIYHGWKTRSSKETRYSMV